MHCNDLPSKDILNSNLTGVSTPALSLSLKYAPVEAEWVSIKRSEIAAEKDTPRSHFDALSRDMQRNCTIVSVKGVGYFKNGPGTSRPTAAKLSKETGSPPSVISLIHPPPGGFHGPILASSVVLAGESCGAYITFHGQTFAPVPIPAGATFLNPQADLASCLPSWNENREFDIWSESALYVKPGFPVDAIWPSNPPREELYCGASFFAHPMVSPCTTKSWVDSPPLWFGVGQERLADSAMVVAQTAASDGVCAFCGISTKQCHIVGHSSC
ncbi:uncharacterized protein CC84DRAFT_419607 [Paraphaeosphaeria sporulosa]|uniref:Uncharacterized protein n=1 Tax=Paraphaeosphaeria sporulosa TaxID=1460663 RepID=A0A177BUL7_9PLEO|nr:uncharacterized protein CC84DRAFT_419607 [Paraphaeosphaeria sporulosa]OAF99153.1 hypothetical protein CC84DRAFT_419607 [Paraphaeosphaeria sporulosa]